MKQKHAILLLFAAFFLAAVAAQVLAAYPDGIDNVTILASERKGPKPGLAIVAQAGNVTWLDIGHQQNTKKWQGFVGNISGSLVLDDLSNDTFYSWNLSTISGEVYASTNCSIDWNLVSTQDDCDVDQSLTGSGSDQVSRTFMPDQNAFAYQVNSLIINTSTICTAYPNVNDTKQTATTLFENIILTTGTVPNGNKTIYVGNLEDVGVAGFDQQEYNFQLLVPVNKTSGFTTYCLYAELE